MNPIQQNKAAVSSENIKTLAKGTGFSIFGQVAQVFIAYIYGIVIARFLGVSDYGIFFLGHTLFNLVAIQSQSGIEDGLMRFIGGYVQQNDYKRIKGVIHFSLLMAAILGVIFGVFVFLGADIIAENIFRKPRLAIVIRYLSLSTPVYSILIVAVASIRGFKIIIPYVLVRKLFMPFTSLVFAFFVLVMGYGLLGLTLSYILAIGFSWIFAMFMLFSFLVRFKDVKRRLPELFKYFSFVSSAFFINISLFLFQWSDLVLLGVFLPSQELGIYFASKKTALMLNFLLISLISIFSPVISHLYWSNKISELKEAYRSTAYWMLILSLPFFLIMVFFPRELLSLFGPVFESGQMCLVILAFGQIVNAFCGANGNLLMMTDNQKWMVFNTIFFIISTIGLSLYLIPVYGMLGAAFANAVTIILANIIVTLEVYFLLKVHPFNRAYFKILFSGLTTALITYFMRSYLPGRNLLSMAVIEGVLVVIIFFGMLIMFGLNENERKFLTVIRAKFSPSLKGRIRL